MFLYICKDKSLVGICTSLDLAGKSIKDKVSFVDTLILLNAP